MNIQGGGLPPGIGPAGGAGDPNINRQAAEKAQQEMMRKLVESATVMLCKCGCTVFREGVQMVKSSAMDPNNPSGQTQIIHIPTLYCIKCMDPFKGK